MANALVLQQQATHLMPESSVRTLWAHHAPASLANLDQYLAIAAASHAIDPAPKVECRQCLRDSSNPVPTKNFVSLGEGTALLLLQTKVCQNLV